MSEREKEREVSKKNLSDSQVIVLVPFRVERVPHSVCGMALPRAVHNNLGERIGEACRERETHDAAFSRR